MFDDQWPLCAKSGHSATAWRTSQFDHSRTFVTAELRGIPDSLTKLVRSTAGQKLDGSPLRQIGTVVSVVGMRRHNRELYSGSAESLLGLLNSGGRTGAVFHHGKQSPIWAEPEGESGEVVDVTVLDKPPLKTSPRREWRVHH